MTSISPVKSLQFMDWCYRKTTRPRCQQAGLRSGLVDLEALQGQGHELRTRYLDDISDLDSTLNTYVIMFTFIRQVNDSCKLYSIFGVFHLQGDDRRTIKSTDFVCRFYRTTKIGLLLYVTRPILSPDISAINLAVELVRISPIKSGHKIGRFYRSSVTGFILGNKSFDHGTVDGFVLDFSGPTFSIRTPLHSSLFASHDALSIRRSLFQEGTH